MNEPLELMQWAAPRVWEMGGGTKREKYIHRLTTCYTQEGAEHSSVITDGSALASGRISQEANLGFDIRKNFLPKLSPR